MADVRRYGSTGVMDAIRGLIDPALENDLNQALGTNETLKENKIGNIVLVQILNELVRLNHSMEAGVELLEKILDRQELVPTITVMPDTVTPKEEINAKAAPDASLLKKA